MRTTLDIDDDVLQAVKDLGQSQRQTAGQVLSALARKGLAPLQAGVVRNGVPVLPRSPGTPILTIARVNELLDEE